MHVLLSSCQVHSQFHTALAIRAAQTNRLTIHESNVSSHWLLLLLLLLLLQQQLAVELLLLLLLSTLTDVPAQ
jgi:hypothetical protein